MADERPTTAIKYETTTIKVLRGMEDRTLAKLEAEGWEIISRESKALRTEISARRAVPARRGRPLVYGGMAVGLIIVVVVGILGEEEPNAGPAADAPSTSASASPAAPSPDVAPEPEAMTSEPTGPAAQPITATSNTDLAALLALGDYCSPEIKAFAAKYDGRAVEFDGSIGALAPHDGADTRFDILISAGDFSATTALGPAFQFRDVNITSDLGLSGDVPDAIGVGTNVGVTATVVSYEESSCLFLLDPLTTTVR